MVTIAQAFNHRKTESIWALIKALFLLPSSIGNFSLGL